MAQAEGGEVSGVVELRCGAIIDAGDLARVQPDSWYVDRVGYVCRTGSRKERPRPTHRLHRVILDVPDGATIDHVNGDPLDNRRQNLRVCSNRENSLNAARSARNTSGFKGVSWARRQRRWRACIAAGALREDGTRRNLHLGYFLAAADAARAYDAAARQHFGEFARCNGV